MRRGLGILALTLILLIGSAAQAQPVIDFNISAPTPGTVSYAGTGVAGDAPLVGTNIEVDSVAGTGVPLNNGVVRNVVGGLLNFTTGNFLDNNFGGGWRFSPGGSITITGGIDLSAVPDGDTTDPEDIPVGSTILSGTFNIVTTLTAIPFGGVLNFNIQASGFLDLKDVRLTNFYGLPPSPPPYVGAMALLFTVSPPVPVGQGPFTSSQVNSGNVVNSVPEPSSIALLSIGAVGAFLGYRRRLKAAPAAA